MIVQELVLKVASRCNINCTYCYVYNMGDFSYLKQPKFMTQEIALATIEKVRDYCFNNDVKEFSFVFHGGEPLLIGKDFYRYFVETANRLLTPEVTVKYAMTTNAIMLDEEWCSLLAELNIPMGISLDGPKEVNDISRVDHKGKGTYDQVIKGLNTALANKDLQAWNIVPAILSVINVSVDPIETYNHLNSLGIHGVSLLLPDCHNDNPPPGISTDDLSMYRDTPYADWLIKIFDLWYHAKGPKVEIGLFRLLIKALLGQRVRYDWIGDEELSTLIIETNGEIQSSCSLKICGDGYCSTNYNIQDVSLEDSGAANLVAEYAQSKQQLSEQCQVCPIKNVCGGGFLPTRFSKERDFDNPSVYCADLMKLITHVQNKVIDELPEAVVKEAGISKITREEVQAIIEERLAALVHQ